MTVSRNIPARSVAKKTASSRSVRPLVEGLEGRILLYSAIGQWTYSSRITYSFMPDGTSIGGTPSVLFQTLNAIAPTATWENQIEQAATPWESNANLNLALVPDDGAPVGTSGDQQDDPRFGDIRIGAIPLPSGVLAETFLPPPSNGGSIAGDIVFNSNVTFQIGGGIDLQTIALHEFGHALGLGDQSTDPNSVMYYNYNGVKTSLDSDDIAGIQSLYGAPQYDQFNTGLLKNGTTLTATNIMPYMNASNDQIALSGLDNTTPGQQENYVVTVPSGAAANMVVTLQSSNLSSLAPGLYVQNSSLQYVAQLTAPTTYGGTLTATIPVTPGQKYYIKVSSVSGLYGRVGAYGLEVNFGTQSQAPIAPPNTVVAGEADGSGGVTTNALVAGGGTGSSSDGAGVSPPGSQWASIGSLSGWAITQDAPQPAGGPVSNPPAVPAGPTNPAQGILGTIFGTIPAPASAAATTFLAAPATQDGAPAIATAPVVAPAPSLVPQAVDIAMSAWSTDPGMSSANDATNTLYEVC